MLSPLAQCYLIAAERGRLSAEEDPIKKDVEPP